MIGTSPPGPFRCGSTTCSVNAVATAASNALPPFSSVAIPTAVAIQCVEVTTPKVPSISGRVVNGSGLMLPMGIQLVVQAAHLTTAGAACQPPVSSFRDACAARRPGIQKSYITSGFRVRAQEGAPRNDSGGYAFAGIFTA